MIKNPSNASNFIFTTSIIIITCFTITNTLFKYSLLSRKIIDLTLPVEGVVQETRSDIRKILKKEEFPKLEKFITDSIFIDSKEWLDIGDQPNRLLEAFSKVRMLY